MIPSRATILLQDQTYALEINAPIDLSWPISFGSEDASAFSLPSATTKPVELGTFVGDTNQGGSVNCHTVAVTPHGNGTHTEGIGHLLDTHDAVLPSLTGAFTPALVLTVDVIRLAQSSDTYDGDSQESDRVISAASIASAHSRVLESLRARDIESDAFSANAALIIRTSEPESTDQPPQFSASNPPYFTNEAMDLMASWNPSHLGTDLPSVDREQCGGRTPNHRRYWRLLDGYTADEQAARRGATITEMVNPRFDAVVDDAYFLQIHAAPWLSDAVLTRPFLYPFTLAPSP